MSTSLNPLFVANVCKRLDSFIEENMNEIHEWCVANNYTCYSTSYDLGHMQAHIKILKAMGFTEDDAYRLNILREEFDPRIEETYALYKMSLIMDKYRYIK